MSENPLLVLADAAGKLLAAYLPDKDEPGAPAEVTLVAAAGQVLCRVEVPDTLQKTGLSAELLETYRLAGSGAAGRLVPIARPGRD